MPPVMLHWTHCPLLLLLLVVVAWAQRQGRQSPQRRAHQGASAQGSCAAGPSRDQGRGWPCLQSSMGAPQQCRRSGCRAGELLCTNCCSERADMLELWVSGCTYACNTYADATKVAPATAREWPHSLLTFRLDTDSSHYTGSADSSAPTWVEGKAGAAAACCAVLRCTTKAGEGHRVCPRPACTTGGVLCTAICTTGHTPGRKGVGAAAVGTSGRGGVKQALAGKCGCPGAPEGPWLLTCAGPERCRSGVNGHG
jgi:hypothetical protein